MTGLVVLHLDRDVAGHLAVALRRHRGDLQRRGYVEPPGLADLETLFLGVVKSDGDSGGVPCPAVLDDEKHAREFLTRRDVSRQAGVGLSTVDKWVK